MVFKHALLVLCIYFIFSKIIIGRPVQWDSVSQRLFWEVQNGMWAAIELNIIMFRLLGFWAVDGRVLAIWD